MTSQTTIEQRTETQAVCLHCGDACGPKSIHTHEGSFCCSGCEAVYRILRDHNLCDYYVVGDESTRHRRPAFGRDDYAVLDQRDVRIRYVEYADGDVENLRFDVPNLHCVSCMWLLDRLHEFDPGIIVSTADISRRQVAIRIKPNVTTIRNVAELLARIGYPPVIRAESTHREDQQRQQERRSLYLRMGVAGFAAGNIMLFGIARYLAQGDLPPSLVLLFNILSIVLATPVVVYSASPWWRSAWGAISHRRINLDVPVALGITAIFIRSLVDIGMGTGDGYLDSFAGLVFFLLIGRLFQTKAYDSISFDRTYRSFFPLYVRRERKSAVTTVPLDDIAPGDTMIVRHGEVIAADSVVLGQGGFVDYSFVTGESAPVECVEGTFVYAGARVIGRAIRCTATAAAARSYLATLWERSGSTVPRSSLLRLSDRFASVFTGLALTIAVAGAAFYLPDTASALDVFTAVLIIACPCALTLAAPITLGTAMGQLGLRNIWLKNTATVVQLADVDAVVFDKTGTLTYGDLVLTRQGDPLPVDVNLAIRRVAASSSHPVSRALAGDMSDMADEVEEGQQTIRGRALGYDVVLGSAQALRNEGYDVEDIPFAIVHAAVNGHYVGCWSAQSSVRHGIETSIQRLHSDGVKTFLASGDTNREAALFASVFAQSEMIFSASPETKRLLVEKLRGEGHHVLMMGDGLNDSVAMSSADVAVAVTDATATLVPACDVIIDGDSAHHIDVLIRYSRTMKNFIFINLGVSVLYNAVGLSLAVSGMLTPLAAAVLMPVSNLTVIGIGVAAARWFGRRAVWES